MTRRSRPRPARWAILVTLGLAALGACGSDPATGDDVASLGTEPTAGAGEESGPTTTLDPQDAFVAYTECMREEGVDMPDPVVSGDGAVSGGGLVVQSEPAGGDPSFDREDDAFAAADEQCRSYLDDALGEIEVNPEQQAEMREQMLAFSECMRDHGLDYPDPVFGDNGQVSVSLDESSGVDFDSSEFQAANEECSSLMGDGPGFSLGSAPPDGGPRVGINVGAAEPVGSD